MKEDGEEKGVLRASVRGSPGSHVQGLEQLRLLVWHQSCGRLPVCVELGARAKPDSCFLNGQEQIMSQAPPWWVPHES